MISVHFQGKPFNSTVIQAYTPTSNTKEAKWDSSMKTYKPSRTYTPKNVLFIIWNLHAKIGNQETPGITGKFGLGVQNESGQRLIEFCQENAPVISNTLFQQHKKRPYT